MKDLTQFNKAIIFLVILFLASILPGCTIRGRQSDIQIAATAFPISRSSSEVQWHMAPGGNMMSLPPRTYYVELEVTYEGRETLDSSLVDVYIYSENSDILFIRVFKDEQLRSGEKATYLIDMDGYYNWFQASQNERSPLTISIFWPKDESILSSTLPLYESFQGDEGQLLSFSIADSFPDIEKLEPVKISQWPRNVPILTPPAVVRKQDNEFAMYFYFRTTEKVEFRNNMAYTSGDIDQDLAKLGISPYTKLPVVTFRPQN